MAYPRLEIESEADPGGAWMTYAVRMKLDLASVKISLEDWQALPSVQRKRLHDMPGEDAREVAAFRQELEQGLAAARRQPPRAITDARHRARVELWARPTKVPEDVAAAAAIDERRWRELPRFARYLLAAFASKADQPERLARVCAEIDRYWPAGDPN